MFCSVVKMRKRQKEEDTLGDMLYMLRGIILMEFLAPDKIANILMANILAVMTHDTFYKSAAYSIIDILLHLTSCFRKTIIYLDF